MVIFQVSLENSNFKQAVEDLTLCLTKRIKALAADSRLEMCPAEMIVHFPLNFPGLLPRLITNLVWPKLTAPIMSMLRRVWPLL